MRNHDYIEQDRGHDTPCWIWQRKINSSGYGAFFRNGFHLAHRWYYTRLRGPIPDGLQLDHLCRVRECVNPAHLEPVTQDENQRRGFWATKTHCSRGHEYDEANTYIRPNGRRDCRACIRDRVRRYRGRVAA